MICTYLFLYNGFIKTQALVFYYKIIVVTSSEKNQGLKGDDMKARIFIVGRSGNKLSCVLWMPGGDLYVIFTPV